MPRSFHGIWPNEVIFHQPMGFPEIRAFPLLFTTISGDYSAVNGREINCLDAKNPWGQYMPFVPLVCFFFNWKINREKVYSANASAPSS